MQNKPYMVLTLSIYTILDARNPNIWPLCIFCRTIQQFAVHGIGYSQLHRYVGVLYKQTMHGCRFMSLNVFCLFQFPATLAVFGYECVRLYRESKKRRSLGNTESVCEATINWTVPNLIFCALCGVLGGTVGGLLGSGGGFILGPLLLEIGVIPQVQVSTVLCV